MIQVRISISFIVYLYTIDGNKNFQFKQLDSSLSKVQALIS